MTSQNQIRINKSTTISKTSKSLIINEEIEIRFNVVSMPGMLSK